MVSLEVRASAVSHAADVVFPVAPVAEKAGMFVDWEGRVRPFEKVLRESHALPDLRVLSGIADEMGVRLGFRTVEQARAEMQDLGAWDGDRSAMPDRVTALTSPARRRPPDDVGAGGDVEAAARRRADARRRRLPQGDRRVRRSRWCSATTLDALGLTAGSHVTLTGDRGSLDAPGRRRRPARRGGVDADDLGVGTCRVRRTTHCREPGRGGPRMSALLAGPALEMVSAAGKDTLKGFGSDAWWVIIIKAVLIFLVLVVLTLFNIWFERRVVARMQHRIGPNVNGPFGLLQSLADGVKLALKEDIIPKAADKVIFLLAPVLSTVPAFLAFAVIPFGPEVRIPFTDTYTPLQLTDMPVGVLFILAISSIGIYGIVLGGWSSGSTYSLLGGLRSAPR